MPRTIVLGVDPGKDGGLFALSHPTQAGWCPWGWRDFKNGGPWREELCMLRSLLRSWGEGRDMLAVIEEVHSHPRDGHVGAFAFGFNFGTWIGLLEGLPIRYLTRPPDVWEAALGLTKNKTEHRQKCMELWPENADLWRPKGADGLADAALLALFGTRFVQANQTESHHRTRIQCACTGFEHGYDCLYKPKEPCL